MKNISFALLFVSITALFYQNCSQPIQDLGVKTSGSARCKNPDRGNVRISNTGNTYTFEVINVDAADRVVWKIGSLGESVEGGMTYTTQLNGSFNNVTVYAAGYSNACEEDERVFNATGVLNNSSCDPAMNIALNPETVTVGNPVAVTLNADSSVSTSSIRWQINQQDHTASGSTFTYTPTQAIHPWDLLVAITATAEFACGSSTVTKSVSRNLVVNPGATGSAQMSSFEPLPLVASGSTVGEDIYKITRNAEKRLSLGIANLKPGTTPTGLEAATGTNCVSGKHCFTLNNTVGATGSAASPNCQFANITIVATGTNDQPSNLNGFIWCYADYCHVGKVKTAAEQCCPVNTYLNNGSCAAATTGHYAPAGNNSQIACTNKPVNATYTGPSADGSNNCPWHCNNGYVQNGQTCVVSSNNPVGNNRPAILTNGSTSSCSGTSCTIAVEASYIANPSNVYIDLRFMNGTSVPANPNLSIPSGSIASLLINGTYKYRFTFVITDATARNKLAANQLALHVVSPSNASGYTWNDPFHKVRPPGTGGGGGPPDPGNCNGNIAYCVID